MQRLGGGAPDCPSEHDDCGTAIPLRITGESANNVDIVLTPGVIVNFYNEDQVLNWLTPPFSSESQFTKAVVDLITNGFWANDVFRKYMNKFNFYYDMTPSYETMAVEGRICSWTSDDQTLLKFHGNSAFADIGGIIMKDYLSSFDCPEHATGLSETPNNRDNIFANSWTVPSMIHHANDYSTFVHEFGHGIFGLLDESSDSRGENTLDPRRHSNVFSSQEKCISRSAQPDTCRVVFDTDGRLWKSDPDTCAMAGGNNNTSVYFGPDCQQMSQCWMEHLGCD